MKHSLLKENNISYSSGKLKRTKRIEKHFVFEYEDVLHNLIIYNII